MLSQTPHREALLQKACCNCTDFVWPCPLDVIIQLTSLDTVSLKETPVHLFYGASLRLAFTLVIQLHFQLITPSSPFQSMSKQLVSCIFKLLVLRCHGKQLKLFCWILPQKTFEIKCFMLFSIAVDFPRFFKCSQCILFTHNKRIKCDVTSRQDANESACKHWLCRIQPA